MAEFTLEFEFELEVRTECELLEDQMSLLPSSEGFELLFDANGGLGSRKSPALIRRVASFLMAFTSAPSSSEPLVVYRSIGDAGFFSSVHTVWSWHYEGLAIRKPQD